MNLKINPSFSLNGEITAPGSKSYSHRAFIAASFAEGVSVIKNSLIFGDVAVTIKILRALGVKILKESDNTYLVRRTESSLKHPEEILDCKNSGTSIRIFSALSLLIEGGLSLKGEFLNKKRPIIPLLDALKEIGGDYTLTQQNLHVKRISTKCNLIRIKGDISSQFISALLMICPLLVCENSDFIQIKVTSPLISYPYIEITMEILKSFGINIQEDITDQRKGNYYITCGQNYRNQLYEIPGDFSSIAFVIAGAVLSPENSEVIINNLNFKKPQGDQKIIEILHKMGANIKIKKEKNQVIIIGNIRRYPLRGIDIDCRDIPDLFPILAIIGAYAEGKTTLYNALSLRIKESDRIAAISRELKKMGVEVKEEGDKLTIYHCNKLKGSVIDHENDHRIAMAFTVAALYADSSSQMNNIEIINDSYPNFIMDMEKLGANLERINY